MVELFAAWKVVAVPFSGKSFVARSTRFAGSGGAVARSTRFAESGGFCDYGISTDNCEEIDGLGRDKAAL